MSTFMNANEGPAEIISKASGFCGGNMPDNAPYFTSNEGIPWPDAAHSKTTFNRAKTLERMVYPAGSGAFGYFECTKDMSEITKASLFSHAGKRTPIFARFSTVTFGKEFPDSRRNPRGFAIKHYTDKGNYDVVGLNWPIFFNRDPMQGPDVVRSQQRNPSNFLLDYNSLFDLLANTPEANHAGMMLFSDHGTPDGWINMNGFGCHTFKWVNSSGNFVYVKYHYIAEHGQKQFSWDEAVKKCGEDPDHSKRQLWSAIERGERPTWTFKVQIMEPSQADPNKLGFDPFDVTKVWPHHSFPLHEVGKLVLNKNPKNYHRDVEQAAFSPGAIVPSIEESPDSLLQFRMFFYRDAQYHRLGVNLHQVPVNCPFMAKSYSSINPDGALRSDANAGFNPHYYPNSFVNKFRPDASETPYQVANNVVSRQSHFFHEGKMPDIAVVLKLVDHDIIKISYLAQQYNISNEYAQGVYALLPDPGFSFSDVEKMARGAKTMTKEERFAPSVRLPVFLLFLLKTSHSSLGFLPEFKYSVRYG
ncbi:catalase [Coprinopsis marcescibilis]|uniref:Catalase n=1 Tax=Coprinopsis marcescibilis TaxID=230819 RepID=A0A5C3KL49_COPMA|nr:catalase [Coprinopsis marcescibilis]